MFLIPTQGCPFPPGLFNFIITDTYSPQRACSLQGLRKPITKLASSNLAMGLHHLAAQSKARLHQQPLPRSEAACMLVRPAPPRPCRINNTRVWDAPITHSHPGFQEG